MHRRQASLISCMSLQGMAAELGAAAGVDPADLLPLQSSTYLAAASMAHGDWRTAETALKMGTTAWDGAADLGNWVEELVLLADVQRLKLRTGGALQQQQQLSKRTSKARQAAMQVSFPVSGHASNAACSFHI